MTTDTVNLEQPLAGRTLRAPQIGAADWGQLMAQLIPMFPGDIAVVDCATSCQFAHYESGIRVTMVDDCILLSASYWLDDCERAVVAEQLRDIALACEMLTGRIATMVRFAQPDGIANGMAVTRRAGGYALFGSHDEPTSDSTQDVQLPSSELVHFDKYVARRNVGRHGIG